MQLVASTLLLCLTTCCFGRITVQMPSAQVLSERIKNIVSPCFIEESLLIETLADKELSPRQINEIISKAIERYTNLQTKIYGAFCSQNGTSVERMVSIPTQENLVRACLKDFPQEIRALGYIQHISVPIKINSAECLTHELKKEAKFLDRFNEPVIKELASRTMDSHDLICFLERSLNEYKDHFNCNQNTSLVSQYKPRIFEIFLRNSPQALEYAASIGLLSIPNSGADFNK